MLRHYLLLLPSFSCVLWALILLLNRKRNTRSQNIWMILMILMAGAAYVWGVFYDGITDYKLYYKLDIIDTTFSLYLFPLAYFYFKSLIRPNWFRWTDMFWLLPGGVIGIISAVFYLAMGPDNAAGYVKEAVDNFGRLNIHTEPIYQIHFFVNIILYYIVLSIQVLVVFVLGAIQLINPKGFLRVFFNDSASTIMKQNRVVLIGLWVLLLIILTAFLGEYYLVINFHDIAHYVMAFTGLVFFYLGYNVYSQTIANSPVSAEGMEEASPGASPMEVEQAGTAGTVILNPQLTILERFNLLVDDRFYLQRNIRLEDVADMLHTNRTYVSRLLKDEFGCSFAEFINSKRIEYACKLMRISPELTQEQIAELTGFVHASTFSRLFKQYTNMTFREAQRR